MSEEFLKCVDEGGKVRTKSHGENYYQRICIKDGKVYLGEIKKKKSS